MREGLGPGHIVLNVDPAPLSQRGTAFQFSAHVRCGQTAAWIKIPLGMEMGLGPGHIVLDGYPAPPPLKGHSPQFSANVPYGQTAGWTKMPLGMEVGHGPGDFIFDGNPVPPHKKRHSRHSIFGQCLLWPNGWMDEDVTLYGSRPRPMSHCVRRTRLPRERGTAVPLSFRSMSIVATVAHLSYC